MKTLILAIAAAILFFVAVSARAQEDPPPTRDMPTGTVLTVQNVQYKAFTLDEYKTLALIYADYLYFIKQNANLNHELTLHLDIEKNYALQVQGLKDLTKTLELDRDYWNTRVKEEQEANKRRETLSGLERFGAWALVAVEAVALGALGIAQVAQ